MRRWQPPADHNELRARLGALCAQDNVIHASMLVRDAQLSTPPTSRAEPPPADALVMVECSTEGAACERGADLGRAVSVDAASIHIFQTLWRLGAQ